MRTARGVELLLITGSPGVGKSSAAELLSDLLAEAGVAHAVVDLDELDRRGALPGPDLHFENLAAVCRNYAAAGVRRLVLAWTLDSAAELARLSGAVPGAWITVCRLRADPATVVARVARRETPSMREQLQAFALKYASRMERERPGDIVLETQGRHLSEVALELGRVSGWLPAGAGEHEVPLMGGRLTGGVIRVGGTVRRPR